MLETQSASTPNENLKKLVTLYSNGQFKEATTYGIDLSNRFPTDPIPQTIIGSIYNKLGDFELAIKYHNQAILLKSNFSEAYYNRANALVGLRKLSEAAINYKIALKYKPTDYNNHYNLANTLNQLRKSDEAIKHYKKAIEVTSDGSSAYNAIGLILIKSPESSDAIKYFKKAIKANSDYTAAYFNLAEELNKLDQPKKAIKKHQKAIKILLKKFLKISPNSTTYQPLEQEIEQNYLKLSDLFFKKNNIAKAIQYCVEVLKFNTASVNARRNLGAMLISVFDYQGAIKHLEKVYQMKPNDINNLNSLANAHYFIQQPHRALKYLKLAIKLKPDDIQSTNNLGRLLIISNQAEKGIRVLQKSKELWNSDKFMSFNDNLLFALNYSPDLTAEEIYKSYEEYDERFGKPLKSEWKPFTVSVNPNRRLRIGYVSPDFRRHSTQKFLEPLLKNHDKDNFELFAFAEIKKEDEVTQTYKKSVDHWIQTNGLSDKELAEKIRELKIDVLVDVAGHTEGNRLGAFMYKPAPVSISWLGFGYTTGLSAIDYFLTDDVMAPPGSEHLFSEKLWRLKDRCFTSYTPTLGMGEVGPLPALKRGYITFGTLSRSIRINDREIDAWSEILEQVKNSKLIINSSDFIYKKSIANLKRKFKKRGITEDRLDIGFISPPWDIMRQIDIALDCFPHNSGTTLFEHLYMGHPFISLASRPSVGRIGSSILSAISGSEWIASSEDEYVQKAVTLASDIHSLSDVRAKLRTKMGDSSLMDGRGFILELEKSFRTMWEESFGIKSDMKR